MFYALAIEENLSSEEIYAFIFHSDNKNKSSLLLIGPEYSINNVFNVLAQLKNVFIHKKFFYIHLEPLKGL